MTTSLPLSRVAAYLDRLSFVGILSGARVSGVVRARGARACDVTLCWVVPHTSGDGTFAVLVPVRLRDEVLESAWDRAVLEALADATGHELGEAVRRNGLPIADPHLRPRVWPWRVTDRESS
jgi:hypothetical protein